jgi:hypothetical protein
MWADAVVVVHLAWILFLILGALPGRRWRGVKYLHIGGLAYALASQTVGWICPLTHLEIWLRRRQSPASAYGDGFVQHYVERLVYADLPAAAILAGTVVVITFSWWWYRRPARC